MVTNVKESAGTEQAFPVPHSDDDIFVPGMNYREYLIGQYCSAGYAPKRAITEADMVIAILDKEPMR
jgi:hypothetical protein